MDSALASAIEKRLRTIPDYPKPGILFRDITPVLGDAQLFHKILEALARPYRHEGISHVVGIEARGFILGGPVAMLLGAGFVPVRKEGKLPWRCRRQEYALEYGTNVVEAHEDAVNAKSKVLIVDDVLATGGTAQAAAELIRSLGATVAGWSFLLEIGGLGGRKLLREAPTTVLLET
ncbi:MAG TPA: adenine phosphoribosyltransferase [Gemmatimonadales bacterium]|nr:adenine phosphoribosyltransferase [Gemmatimonadales bacterium]